jgi:hypothetical protein
MLSFPRRVTMIMTELGPRLHFALTPVFAGKQMPSEGDER